MNYQQACSHLKAKLRNPNDQAALRIVLQGVSASLSKDKRFLERLKTHLLEHGQLTITDWQEIERE